MPLSALSSTATDQPELAFLRQFLRAALNDRFAGDEIAALLAKHVELPEDAPTDDPMQRCMCYVRSSLSKWRELRGDRVKPSDPFDPNSAIYLQAPDHALDVDVALLSDVFGLPVAASAEMLGISEADAERYREAERKRRAHKLEGRALVIEDDPIIALNFQQVLENCGLGEIVLTGTVDDAVNAARDNRPDLIISDYDLGGGGTGVDAVRAILMEMDCAVVFVSAYPGRVLTGADFEPTFVMAKPFADESLSAAIFYALTRPGFSTIDADLEDDP